MESGAGRQIDSMLTHSAVGTPAQVREQLVEFRRFADADELIVGHASAQVEQRLRSVQLLAEAMETSAPERHQYDSSSQVGHSVPTCCGSGGHGRSSSWVTHAPQRALRRPPAALPMVACAGPMRVGRARAPTSEPTITSARAVP